MLKSIFLFLAICAALNVNAQPIPWDILGNNNIVNPTNFLGTTNAAHLDIKTNNTHRMRIDLNGNVGIGTGTSTPAQRFQVKGGNILLDYASGTTTGNLFFGGNTASNSNGMRLSFANGSAPNAYIDVRTPTTNNNYANGLIFRIDGGIGSTERMRIRTDGKVLIGVPTTSTPGNYRLYVKDGILTERVKVALYNSVDWADYVFAPDYHLRPLEEVEAFVQQNNHLPGIPSAQELVQEGGIDLGAMQAKQMEKIEELTLYLIDMKKEINAIKAENAELKTALSNR
ncbi:MAG: hypothetical protein IT269_09405 [Saprospiraceae bacterium]|nr:hypothetical protein [Saprospiraceae bacterium]